MTGSKITGHQPALNSQQLFSEQSDPKNTSTPKLVEHNNPDMRKNTDECKVLIIGCGTYDKFTGCPSEHEHARYGETTIDILPQVQPDILADITEPNIQENPNYQAVARDIRFGDICLEAVPHGLFDTSIKRNTIADNIQSISRPDCKITVATGSVIGRNLPLFGECLRQRGFSDIKIFMTRPELVIMHAYRTSVD